MVKYLPECVRVKATKSLAQTFVVKVLGHNSHESLYGFGSAEIVLGAGSFAIIHRPIQDEYYIVISYTELHDIGNIKLRMTNKIENLVKAPSIGGSRRLLASLY